MRLAFMALFAGIGVGVASGVAGAEGGGAAHGGETARGVVFNDRDGNGLRDDGEPGIPGVLISNGRDVVASDDDGRYEIGVDGDDIVFLIKPRGAMTPVSERGLPRFFYVHKPEGSPASLRYGGVAPTGPLPESIDFPLVARPEPDSFRVILFGDPQPYSIAEVNAFAHDVVEEVIGAQEQGVGAAFGVSLGDLVGDDLSLFGPYVDVVSSVGLPWYNVHGNHDMNFDVDSDALADETYERVFGPATYAFVHGPVLFFVLDNVVYEGVKPDGKPGGYHAALSDDQLAFIENVLERAGHEFVVLMMHIPLVEVSNRDALLALLGETPCFSLGAHWHRHGTYFLREGEDTGRHDHGSGIEHGAPEDGDSSHADHHVHIHVVQGTTSGSWYQGAPDEYGLPHTMMRDGKPNGWSILAFERTPSGELDYAIRYKAARRPWADQLHLWAPEEVGVASSAEVIANVYAGSERSTVEMRVRHVASGLVSAWAPMEMHTGVDPYWAALKRLESSETPPPGKKLTNLEPETLLWRGTLAPMDEPGAAVIEVRTTDMFGQTFTGRRLVRVVEANSDGPAR